MCIQISGGTYEKEAELEEDSTMKITKIRYFIDDQKEEAWINEMSAQGWHLQKHFSMVFKFEKGEPGKYIYRNEFINWQEPEYLDFLKDANIECVSKFFGWTYFRKEAVEGPFELYTDADSKLRYLTKLFNLYLMILIPNFMLIFLNAYLGFLSERTKYLSFGTAGLSFACSLLMFLAVYKVQKRRKTTKKSLLLFER